MVHIEKRKLIWDLYSIIDDFKSRQVSYNGAFGRITEDIFLSELAEYGFKPDSRVLHDIVALAVVENDQRVDLDLLFHVISQAVQKVLDRNLMFWNTIISVSAPSIAWIDFRRKLLKWLSNNGVGPAHAKNVLYFAEKALDKDGLGIVRKEDFLKFTEELMGIDCLLTEEIIRDGFHGTKPVRRKSIPVLTSRSKLVNRISPLNPLNESGLRKTPDQYSESSTGIRAPIVPLRTVADAVQDGEESSASAPGNNESNLIRIRLGIGILERLTDGRMRYLFGVYRSLVRNNDTKEISAVNHAQVSKRVVVAMVLIVQAILFRLKANSFKMFLRNESESSKTPLLNEPEEEAGSGPSWTVTMQAMAVATLHGILRNAITRAVYPGLMSIRTGKTIDEIYAIKRVSYSQSKQGRMDAQAAMGMPLLDPIKENLPSTNLEFDLST